MTLLHPVAAAAAGLVLGVTALTAANEPDPIAMPMLSPRCEGAPICGPRLPSFQVGDIAVAEHLHLISRPGLYGLAMPPRGELYAVMDGQIVRIHADTAQVRSILRMAPRILD
nr:hypothetical protein [Paracoccus saliphilus]